MDLKRKLESFPKKQLLDAPTPIQRLHGIEKRLGDKRRGVRIWAKRDDYMSLGGGGNKLRKLEFLLADAVNSDCNVIVAVGGVQSNFARLAAASCARLGLGCELVLARMVPREGDLYEQNGNVLLNKLYGARVHMLEKGADALAHALEIAETLENMGHRPYIATLGGSTPIGCLGYVSCAQEVVEQATAMGISFANIVTANGSAGTQAGLVAAFALLGLPTSAVRGFTVLSPLEQALRNTTDKANSALSLLGSSKVLTEQDINLSAEQLGRGYGVPTESGLGAIRMVASCEGIPLDPVYSGKAFAGLLDDLGQGAYQENSDVLFLMTGGSAGLFAYADEF
ncbi:D-cysteine desulfhydrase family protein [Ensifer sp. ENS04]|uniref:D-cysteine desulfhydrase family protein n=1 Tax=Ensifer sp. ENS04 TaxID=2769281 RepID=UPI00177B41F8|nr:D-cysteine desulfhydrase family protein [Ensifer sp. ENS04]MBD9541380.1 D-cysteine desulfhydrase family protein [Ensifer sp. ENS04]